MEMGKAVRMSQRPSKSPYKCSQRVQQRDVPTPLGNRSSNVVGQHTSTQVLATCMMTPELRNEVVQIVNALIHSPATVSVTSPDSVNERQQSNTDDIFVDNLLQQDIFCLQGTHCYLDNCLELPNFQRPVHLIRRRTKPSWKRHGGLSVYILNTIRPGVKFLEHATNDFIWLKLDRTFFGFQESLFICFVYNPPENSSYYRKFNYNILEMIENDIVKYSQSGKIMIAGDLNARTSCEIDHYQMDSDKHIPLFDNYKCDSSLIQRKSKDSSINTRGRQLLSLCISSSLRILNGRTMGDLMGAHTCFQPLGSSVVDFSDHCQISCMLKCNTKIYERNLNLALMPDKYIWDDNSVSAFQDAINSNEIKNFIRQYKDKIYDQDSINNAAEDLNKIFLKAADLSLKKIIRKPKKKARRRKLKRIENGKIKI
ncbi:Hypothetical predicted protein [Mytilus galloprovincialis]|uniref:Endonuclease/exonuclease/phosphatase domain-containing protein n=1 Tax=Mytilus galloprovincialis TaxID=29158 RepID=A0A8B6CLM7_MYTGA|nr:Hypothetical predicted protein [Mytilus galloprovincialis]